MLGGDGGLFAFGNAPFFGSLPEFNIKTTVVDMDVVP